MTQNKNHQKTDRRTIYTRQTIRDAFLQLKQGSDFNSITVAAVCRKAGVSRGTFYLHYRNTMEVLDEIVDMILAQTHDVITQLSLSPEEKPCGLTPFCSFMRTNTQYHCIFLDDSLSSWLIEKVLAAYREDTVNHLARISSLSRQQLDAILYFQFSGCFAAAKKNIRLRNPQWNEIQCCLDTFIKGGLDRCLETDRSDTSREGRCHL